MNPKSLNDLKRGKLFKKGETSLFKGHKHTEEQVIEFIKK